MATLFDEKLAAIEGLINSGLSADALAKILSILEAPPLSVQIIENIKLYSETLPKAQEMPFTHQQRYLHYLWDYLDRLALGLIVSFSIPFRRLIAKHLFKRCGAALIAEENVTFNFGQFIELGDQVFFNRGVFLDSKGGIIIGDFVALAEDVKIFTHTHSEASHLVRDYRPVVIEDYAKVYAGATIFPGVTIGKEAIVGSGSTVTKDVPPGMVVAGVPAKVIRERKTENRHEDELDHIWLF
jgi:acetyltransferase-like isoleucine patch superfamily enzyme